MKKLVALTVFLTCMILTGSLSAGEYTGPSMKSKLATEDLEGDEAAPDVL